MDQSPSPPNVSQWRKCRHLVAIDKKSPSSSPEWNDQSILLDEWRDKSPASTNWDESPPWNTPFVEKSAPTSSPAKKRMKYSTTAIETPKLSRDDSIICLDDSFEESKCVEKPIGEASSFTATKATARKDAETKDPAIKIKTSKNLDPGNATKSKIDSKFDWKRNPFLQPMLRPPSERKPAPSSSTPVKKKKKYTTTIENPVLSPNDSIFNDSFDELKRPEKPIGEVVVRKKDERRKLHGHDCPCCKDYYDSLGLSPESRARRVNEISRHRKTYRPYKRVKTPEHFWDLKIPDTQECIRRGYLKRNF